MKTLTTDQETERVAVRKPGIHRLWEIKWPDPFDTQYFGQYVFSPDPGVTVIPKVRSTPELSRGHTLGLTDLIETTSTSLQIDNDPSDPERIQHILTRLPSVTGVEVTVYEMFEPATGSLSTADWITIGVWRIADFDATPPVVDLELKPFFTTRASLKFGETANAEDFPTSPNVTLNELLKRLALLLSLARALLLSGISTIPLQ